MLALPRSGTEWLVDARGCEPGRLRDTAVLAALFDEVMRDLELRAVQPPVWHSFPDTGGVTGLALLAESHLACHTFPEFGAACFNLFCCRPRQPWAWQQRLARALGATAVDVVAHARKYG